MQATNIPAIISNVLPPADDLAAGAVRWPSRSRLF
jgi:hypothetical protein